MVRLGNCFTIIRNGASIKQIDGASGLPITRIETISKCEINRDKFGYANICDEEKYKDYFLHDDDILMSHINSEKHLGKCAIYHKEKDEKIIHGMNLLMLRANKTVISPQYAVYYFETPFFKQQIVNITKKSVNQASFTVTALKEIEIPLLSYEKQNKIVKILDKLNEIINKRQQQLKKLDELVKSRFIEMFGDPVKNEKNLPLEQLSKIGILERGKSQYRPRNAPELLGGPYPLIQTGDVSNSNIYITTYSNTYSELGLKQSKLWEPGTLCITIAANIAQTAILTFKACFPDSVVGFIPNNNTNIIFIHYWFGFFQKVLEEQAPQVAQKNINLKILSELKVILPSIELQNQFADFVKQTDKSKFVIQKSLNYLL